MSVIRFVSGPQTIIQDLRVLKANAWIDRPVGDPSANRRSIEMREPSRIHYHLNIYSSSGTLVMRRTGNADILTQNFDLAANLRVQGMYIAELVTAEGRVCAKVPYVER